MLIDAEGRRHCDKPHPLAIALRYDRKSMKAPGL
jgi:hypothetical protein